MLFMYFKLVVWVEKIVEVFGFLTRFGTPLCLHLEDVSSTLGLSYTTSETSTKV